MGASQKTEVSSREARVARPQDVHPGQGSTALRRADPAVFPHDLVPGQGSTVSGGVSLGHSGCHGEGGSGAARHLRERRLRAVQRYVRMAVQLALAEKLRERGGAAQRPTGTGEESWQGGGRARAGLRAPTPLPLGTSV